MHIKKYKTLKFVGKSSPTVRCRMFAGEDQIVKLKKKEMPQSRNKRKNGKEKTGNHTTKNHFRVNCMTGQITEESGNGFISDAKFHQIESHLSKTLLTKISLRQRKNDKMKLSDDECKDLCGCIFASRLLKKGEIPEGSAMSAVPKKRGQAYWNIGMFGSVWCDLTIFNGRSFRVCFLNDGTFGLEGEL